MNFLLILRVGTVGVSETKTKDLATLIEGIGSAPGIKKDLFTVNLGTTRGGGGGVTVGTKEIIPGITVRIDCMKLTNNR